MFSAIFEARFVSVQVDGAVAYVNWSRPERRNAIGRELATELIAALEYVLGRPELAAVVLRSAGVETNSTFCAGWDVNDFKQLDGSSYESFFAQGRQLLDALSALPQVTIAAPAGAVIGFGCSMLARCDFAIAADDVIFALPEIRRGIPPATVLAELVGVMTPRAALAWAVTGDRIDAARALADGLLTGIVARDVLEAEVDSLARRIAAFGPELVHETKALVGRMREAGAAERIRIGVASAVDRMRRSSGAERAA